MLWLLYHARGPSSAPGLCPLQPATCSSFFVTHVICPSLSPPSPSFCSSTFPAQDATFSLLLSGKFLRFLRNLEYIPHGTKFEGNHVSVLKALSPLIITDMLIQAYVVLVCHTVVRISLFARALVSPSNSQSPPSSSQLFGHGDSHLSLCLRVSVLIPKAYDLFPKSLTCIQ